MNRIHLLKLYGEQDIAFTSHKDSRKYKLADFGRFKKNFKTVLKVFYCPFLY